MNIPDANYPGTAHSRRVATFLYTWCEVHPHCIPNISSHLDLAFLDINTRSSNLCYVNNSEVRDDFKTAFSTEDIFHYFYGIMHATRHREQYGKFLYSNKDLVPTPENSVLFWKIASHGKYLIETHTDKDQLDPCVKTAYYGLGDDKVLKGYFIPDPIDTTLGAFYINNSQYFSPVSSWAWNFKIGPSRPLPQWARSNQGAILTDKVRTAFINRVEMIERTRYHVMEIDSLIDKGKAL